EKPTVRQEENAKAAKKARRTQRAAMTVAAKRTQDQCGREGADDTSEPIYDDALAHVK
ncbi:hypothetical protein L915_12497, partial [Phytophthora nicotianae]